MKKIRVKFKNLKNLNISIKLLLSTAVLILVSVFLVTFLSYKQYTKDLKNQSNNNVQQILGLLTLNIDTYLDDLFRLSISPYYDDNVMDALDNKIDDNDLMFLNRQRTVEGFLDTMMINPRPDIIRVIIITNQIYKSDRLNASIDLSKDYKSYDWYKEATKKEGPVFVPAHLEQLVKNPKNIVFSVVNIIRSKRNLNRVLGVIKVDANYSGIEAICNKAYLGSSGGLFIIDENENIIFSSLNNISRTDYINIYKSVKNSKNSYDTIKIDGKKYLANKTKTATANWTVIGLSSLNEINKIANNTRNTSFLLSIICSFLAIIVLIIFIKWFLKPLLNIISKIKQIQNGNLKVNFEAKQNDEIGYLSSSLNSMVKRIDSMMEENTSLAKQVYEAKYLEKEAQINALFNQIRPHFIYNTLNMISLLIQCDKDEEAVDNINKLSKLLRTMANFNKIITVGDEISLLDAYLSIQFKRFDNRLEYSIDVDKSLYSYKIPPLILQPIVENAVIHGCESRKDKTLIKIRSREEKDKIIFIVEDDGEGIEEEALKNLQHKIDSEEETDTNLSCLENKSMGIGLVNVNRRLQIKYGKSYGLKIYSKVNEGTNVQVILPKNHEGGSSNV